MASTACCRQRSPPLRGALPYSGVEATFRATTSWIWRSSRSVEATTNHRYWRWDRSACCVVRQTVAPAASKNSSPARHLQRAYTTPAPTRSSEPPCVPPYMTRWPPHRLEDLDDSSREPSPITLPPSSATLCCTQCAAAFRSVGEGSEPFIILRCGHGFDRSCLEAIARPPPPNRRCSKYRFPHPSLSFIRAPRSPVPITHVCSFRCRNKGALFWASYVQVALPQPWLRKAVSIICIQHFSTLYSASWVSRQSRRSTQPMILSSIPPTHYF